LRGFSRRPPGCIRQSSRKLLIGAPIDPRQSIETKLSDSRGAEFAAGVPDLSFNTVNEETELPGIEGALVSSPVQAPEQLLAVEGLAMAVALDHLQSLRDRPLVGGEAMPARRALATPAKGGAVLGLAGLEDGGGGVAVGAIHSSESSVV
jgi:hypothetical protein